MNRRNLHIRSLCLLICIFFLLSGTVDAHSISNIALVGTENLQTQQTIVWKTTPGETTLLEIAPQNEAGSLAEKAVTMIPQKRILFTNPGMAVCNSVFLTNLKPDTTYSYRISSQSKGQIERSPAYTFHTAKQKANSFSFLVFGDSQNDTPKNPSYASWKTTCEAAYASHPEAKFFINLGDLVEEGQNYPHWLGWFDAAQNVIDKIPAYAILGNHETYVPNTRGSAEPEFWEKQWPMPTNGPLDLKRTAYSFDYGPVHFSVLNTQEKEYRQFGPSILAEQKAWLEKDLAATHKPWKIILGHKPVYSISTKRTSPEIKKCFGELIEKYHVDLVLNGHEHAIARSDGHPLYYIAGESGGKLPRNIAQNPPYAFISNNNGQPNYLFISVTPTSILIKCIGQNGNLLDAYTLMKNPTASPAQKAA